jgi:hypothetical protein
MVVQVVVVIVLEIKLLLEALAVVVGMVWVAQAATVEIIKGQPGHKVKLMVLVLAIVT